jgi:hypothetical protein
MPDGILIGRVTCQALVITCSDFRFKTAERRFLESIRLADDYDLIARPGAIRSIVQPRSSAARDTMDEEIRLLWGLHKFTRIVALNHLSCRAYDDIATALNERDVHTVHLQKSRELLDARFAGVRAELYLASAPDGDIRVEQLG